MAAKNYQQNYNNFSKRENNGEITCYVLAKINAQSLKLLSEAGLNIEDWRYVPMVEQYQNMAAMNIKREAVYTALSEEYGVSVSSVKRIIRRMLKRVRM